MHKWKINEHEIERNPDYFAPRPTKNVSYKRTVSGNQIREVPKDPNVAIVWEMDATWSFASESLKNYLYDLYIMDSKISLETHVQDGRDKWVVKIDSFNAECLPIKGGDRFNVEITFRAQNGILDPIVTRTYSGPVYSFPIENTTNKDISDVAIFLRSTDKEIVNPKIVQTYKNLLQNPGFEQATNMLSLSAWDTSDVWKSDIIYFLEGHRCIKTNKSDSPLTQTVYCPSDADMTLRWHYLGDTAGLTVKASVTFYDDSGDLISSVEESVKTKELWMSEALSLRTPPNTCSACVSFEKAGEHGADYVYLDAVALTVGDGYSDVPHSELKFEGSIKPNDVFRLDLRTNSVLLNNQDVSQSVIGNYFYLPPGESVIVFSDENDTLGNIEATIRYNGAFN